MRLITKNTDYAVRALCHIAGQKNRVVSAAELADKLSIPGPYLRKILRILTAKKILRSFKGQGGGFALERPPGRIFLGSLIKIFQGPSGLGRCITRGDICPNIKTCMLKKKIEDIERNIAAELRSTTIKSLIVNDR